jgi:hypothetical protein
MHVEIDEGDPFVIHPGAKYDYVVEDERCSL